MQSRAPDLVSIQEETSSEAFECKLINCPNCKQEVPETIYCLRCGFPIYGMKQLEQSKAESNEEPLEDPRTIPELEISGSKLEESEKLDDKILEMEEFPVESEIIEPVLEEYNLSGEARLSKLMSDIEYPPVELELLPISDITELLPAPDKQVLLPEISLEIHDKIVVIEKPVIIQDVKILVDDYPEVENEHVEDLPVPAQVPFNEPIANVTIGEESEEMHGEYMPEPATQELLKDLMNSISLKLWAVDLLTKERAKEDHFINLYEGYKNRYDRCMSQRNKMLEKAKDLEPLEKELDTARVGIGELEIRKALGDLRKGEYEAKVPAYTWDIQYYESELAKRNGEIAYLENPAKLLPSNEVEKLKDLAQRNNDSLNQLEADEKISVSSAEMVRNDLQKDLGFLKGLQGY